MSGTCCTHCGQALPAPDEVRFYYMADRHHFYRLTGSIHEAAEQAKKIAVDEPYGMLCPPILMKSDKEVRRVEGAVHMGPRAKWSDFCAEVDQWVTRMLTNPDIERLARPTPSTTEKD